MDIKDRVTSLELSKKLKLLNVKQKSLFYWEYVDDQCYGINFIPYCVCPLNGDGFKHFSAFTASELMELLPARINIKKNEPFKVCLVIQKIVSSNTQYMISYVYDTFLGVEFLAPVEIVVESNAVYRICDENLCDGLAKTLIYLIENGLMEVDK